MGALTAEDYFQIQISMAAYDRAVDHALIDKTGETSIKVLREEARSQIFEYIEIYYHRQRKHSAIGHQIPLLVEAA